MRTYLTVGLFLLISLFSYAQNEEFTPQHYFGLSIEFSESALLNPKFFKNLYGETNNKAVTIGVNYAKSLKNNWELEYGATFSFVGNFKTDQVEVLHVNPDDAPIVTNETVVNYTSTNFSGNYILISSVKKMNTPKDLKDGDIYVILAHSGHSFSKLSIPITIRKIIGTHRIKPFFSFGLNPSMLLYTRANNVGGSREIEVRGSDLQGRIPASYYLGVIQDGAKFKIENLESNLKRFTLDGNLAVGFLHESKKSKLYISAVFGSSLRSFSQVEENKYHSTKAGLQIQLKRRLVL